MGRETGREAEIEITPAMIEAGMSWACGVFGQPKDRHTKEWICNLYRDMRRLEADGGKPR